ncbi:MAG: S1/P1 nuclease [Rhodocyclaceae bacterium]|nr:S1/P1 nuclease [Rhodocyclaceae bacterium]
MKQLLLALLLSLAAPVSHAWNAAGHRLTAIIAWQQLSLPTQQHIAEILAKHPDYERWLQKAKSTQASAIFAEASTWPDDIRNDPRFHEELGKTPPIPGLADNRRHKNWHFVNLNSDGSVKAGLLDQKIEEFSHLLRSTAKIEQIYYALPWLLHLVGDIHQPLHVGQYDDNGGNAFEIENPYNHRLPFSSLHTYWDDLPGPPWLRGKRLTQKANRLIASHPPPKPATVRIWRSESLRLLAHAYPSTAGSLLPSINEDFHRQANRITEQRIVDAGFRLGHLLENIWGAGVPRGTP